jgi:hypothetical protein
MVNTLDFIPSTAKKEREKGRKERRKEGREGGRKERRKTRREEGRNTLHKGKIFYSLLSTIVLGVVIGQSDKKLQYWLKSKTILDKCPQIRLILDSGICQL